MQSVDYSERKSLSHGGECFPVLAGHADCSKELADDIEVSSSLAPQHKGPIGRPFQVKLLFIPSCVAQMVNHQRRRSEKREGEVRSRKHAETDR